MTDTLTKTAATNAPINDTRKAELLSKQVKHIDIRSFDARRLRWRSSSKAAAGDRSIFGAATGIQDARGRLHLIAETRGAGDGRDERAHLVAVDVRVSEHGDVIVKRRPASPGGVVEQRLRG